jgi:rhodanese-related sulfurtransferase
LATALWHPRRPDWTALRAPVEAVRQVDLADARAEFADALWLDAREPAAYAAGHVPGALALGETDWETGFAALMESWDGARPLVVYCGGESCHASEAVARRLKRELGFDRIVVLRGGWDAWRAAAATAEADKR